MSAGLVKAWTLAGEAIGERPFAGELGLASVHGAPRLEPGRELDLDRGVEALRGPGASCGPKLLLRGGNRVGTGPALGGTAGDLARGGGAPGWAA